MAEQAKVRENRLRRMARRRGLMLRKSRTRDRGAIGYGKWRVVQIDVNGLLEDNLDLDQVEECLNEYKVVR